MDAVRCPYHKNISNTVQDCRIHDIPATWLPDVPPLLRFTSVFSPTPLLCFTNMFAQKRQHNANSAPLSCHAYGECHLGTNDDGCRYDRVMTSAVTKNLAAVSWSRAYSDASWKLGNSRHELLWYVFPTPHTDLVHAGIHVLMLAPILRVLLSRVRQPENATANP